MDLQTLYRNMDVAHLSIDEVEHELLIRNILFDFKTSESSKRRKLKERLNEEKEMAINTIVYARNWRTALEEIDLISSKIKVISGVLTGKRTDTRQRRKLKTKLIHYQMRVIHLSRAPDARQYTALIYGIQDDIAQLCEQYFDVVSEIEEDVEKGKQPLEKEVSQVLEAVSSEIQVLNETVAALEEDPEVGEGASGGNPRHSIGQMKKQLEDQSKRAETVLDTIKLYEDGKIEKVESLLEAFKDFVLKSSDIEKKRREEEIRIEEKRKQELEASIKQKKKLEKVLTLVGKELKSASNEIDKNPGQDTDTEKGDLVPGEKNTDRKQNKKEEESKANELVGQLSMLIDSLKLNANKNNTESGKSSHKENKETSDTEASSSESFRRKLKKLNKRQKKKRADEQSSDEESEKDIKKSNGKSSQNSNKDKKNSKGSKITFLENSKKSRKPKISSDSSESSSSTESSESTKSSSSSSDSLSSSDDKKRKHRKHRKNKKTSKGKSSKKESKRQLKRIPVADWKLKYDGKDGGKKLAEFLKEVKLRSRSEDFSEKELFRSAIHLFSGRAKDWYIEGVENDVFRSWSELKKELKREFRPHDLDFQLEIQATNRKQARGEKFSDYFYEMQKIFQNMSKQISDSRKFELIWRNMRHDYKNSLTGAGIKSLSKLRKYGRIIDENNWNMFQKPSDTTVRPRTSQVSEVVTAEKGKSKTSSSNSGKSTRIFTNSNKAKSADQGKEEAKAENKKAKVSEEKSDTMEGSSKGTMTQLVAQYKRPPIGTCYNCRESGHHYVECPLNKKKFCRICGFLDVYTTNCPLCQKNAESSA